MRLGDTRMTIKIKSIISINDIKHTYYTVGHKYSGVILHEIKDQSLLFESSYHSIFSGYDARGNLIFSFDRLPVEIIYEAQS